MASGPNNGIDSWQIYGKKLASGATAALLLNRGSVPMTITLAFSDVWVEPGSKVTLRDLWAEKDLPGGATAGPTYAATAVPPHGNVALLLRPN